MSTKKYTYVLRTNTADNTSRNGFKWPESGFIEAPDFKPTLECGNGLHGLNMGAGNPELLNWNNDAKWLVVKVLESDIIDLGDKVKFSKGEVVYCGDRKGATDYIISKGANPSLVPGAFITVGDNGTASAGYKGTATAGKCGTASAGYMGTAMAGNHGTANAGDCGTASAGNHGTATTGNDGTAMAGNDGTAMAGDWGTASAGNCGTANAGYKGTASAGNCGTAIAGEFGTAIAGEEGIATAGKCGTASAGENGTISIRYYDGKRMRIKTGYIGEDGLKPNTKYRLNDKFEFVVA